MMNERVRELLVEAGVINNNFNPLAYEQWYLDSLEKFAELIVGECARIAAQTPFPDADEDIRKTFGHTWDMACVKSAKDIRKHFGVK